MANFNVTDGAPFPPTPAAAVDLPDSKRTVVPVASRLPSLPPPARDTSAVSEPRASFDVASVPAVRPVPNAAVVAVAVARGWFFGGAVALSLLMLPTAAAEAAVARRTRDGRREN